ncbi:MAG: aminotransferase class V-fold PLP-dependent enzyme [Bdellovibrio sp.]
MSTTTFRSQFFNNFAHIHLNNAGLAPISYVARQKIHDWADQFYREGFASDAEYVAEALASKAHLSRLLGCEPSDVAFFSSTAGGVNQVAFGLDLQSDDEVLVLDQDYSSLLYPFLFACKNRGAKLRTVASEPDFSINLERLISALSAKTKVLALSWVQYQTGAQLDFKTLIHEAKARGVFVFVDVMQGVGLHPCDLWSWGVDAMVGGSHKWLVSPVGVGYLALRPEWVLKMQPLLYGSGTFGSCDEPSNFACAPKLDASKFEPGSRQILEITALGASCKMIHEFGVPLIQAESLRLAQRLRSGLRDLGYRLQTPAGPWPNSIVNFVADQERMNEIREIFDKNKILSAIRAGGIRLSPHAFNSDDEIDKVLNFL